jgi:hypothetical protein
MLLRLWLEELGPSTGTGTGQHRQFTCFEPHFSPLIPTFAIVRLISAFPVAISPIVLICPKTRDLTQCFSIVERNLRAKVFETYKTR